MQSDSDYNPVEEPAWLQQDSLQASHFSYTAGRASPSDTPRIRAYVGVEESTAVASPLRHGRTAKPGPLVGESMEEIMTFVRDKVRCLCHLHVPSMHPVPHDMIMLRMSGIAYTRELPLGESENFSQRRLTIETLMLLLA